MIGFKTRNSVYYVNTVNRTITGGKLGDKIYSYIQAKIIQGFPAVIQLENGKVITTGTVECYI